MVTDKWIEGISGFRVVGKNGYTAEREVTLMDHRVQLYVGFAKAWPRCRVPPVYISAWLQTNKVSFLYCLSSSHTSMDEDWTCTSGILRPV
jgi:hypothetical protein